MTGSVMALPREKQRATGSLESEQESLNTDSLDQAHRSFEVVRKTWSARSSSEPGSRSSRRGEMLREFAEFAMQAQFRPTRHKVSWL